MEESKEFQDLIETMTQELLTKDEKIDHLQQKLKEIEELTELQE